MVIPQLSKLKPGVRFPLPAHMEELRRKVDPESPESRTEGHEFFTKLMRRLGVDAMTPEQRLDWIKNTDAKAFLGILSRGNGRLAHAEKVQRWEGKGVKSVVGFAGNTESPDLEPPENAEEDFSALYEQMRREVTPENVKQWAAKLYAATIFAHMFPNGNGRTARYLYALLTREGLPGVELGKERGRIIEELGSSLNIAAMKVVFQKHGFEWDDQRYFATIDHNSMGNMDFLKFVAAREVLEEEGVSPDGSIELTQLKGDQKQKFDERYAKIRKEWYSEVIGIVDKYADYVTEQLDKAVGEKEKV